MMLSVKVAIEQDDFDDLVDDDSDDLAVDKQNLVIQVICSEGFLVDEDLAEAVHVDHKEAMI